MSLCRLCFAVGCVLSLASLVLPACGGGGGDEEQVQLDFSIASTPDLDGVVFGDNNSTNSRPDLQPTVGDGQFTVGAGAGRFVAYFSFDISELPPNTVIKTATLSLFCRDTQGDPQGMMVLVRVDHVEYGAVFPVTLLGGTGLDSNFATINDIGTVGRKNIDVREQLQADLDAGRATSQYRLRGAIATNADNIADIAFLSDGEDSFGSNELPLLVIEIEQP